MSLTDGEQRVIDRYERDFSRGAGLTGLRLRLGARLLGWRPWTPLRVAGYLAVALLVLLPPWPPAVLVGAGGALVAGQVVWWAATRWRRPSRRSRRRGPG